MMRRRSDAHQCSPHRENKCEMNANAQHLNLPATASKTNEFWFQCTSDGLIVAFCHLVVSSFRTLKFVATPCPIMDWSCNAFVLMWLLHLLNCLSVVSILLTLANYAMAITTAV